MNYLQGALLVSGLGVIWFATGYFAVWALVPAFALMGEIVNLLASLVLVALVTRTETGYRFFYEGVRQPGQLSILVLFLFACPVLYVFAGLFWWALNLLARYLNF